MSAFDLCGVALQSPFIAASGPLSYNAAGMLRLHRAGAGAVVTKTIRLEACINPIPHMVRNSRDSLVNCEKWADLPPEAWIASEIPQAHQAGVVVIASVGHTLPESSRLVEKVVEAGAAMVELVSYDEADLAPMVADARRRLGCPILVKLSPNGRNLAEIGRRCVAAGADAVTACDSVGPVLRIDIRTGRPLLGGVGGAGWLSGSAIKPMVLQRVAELRQVLTCPIIGLGGVTDAADALEMLTVLPFTDMDDIKIDHHRALRQGFPEVVFCLGKTVDQIVRAMTELARISPNVLASRATPEIFEAVQAVLPDVYYNERARMVVLEREPLPKDEERFILVMTAGTGDVPVAEEAAITAEVMGNRVERVFDVGVAGIHRLLAQGPLMRQANVLVVVAGMEGALASVVGGMVNKPVVAVPTSIGYGANFHGLSALLAMLNSCAAGVAVVNIDNGFGAGRLAAIINRMR